SFIASHLEARDGELFQLIQPLVLVFFRAEAMVREAASEANALPAAQALMRRGDRRLGESLLPTEIGQVEDGQEAGRYSEAELHVAGNYHGYQSSAHGVYRNHQCCAIHVFRLWCDVRDKSRGPR